MMALRVRAVAAMLVCGLCVPACGGGEQPAPAASAPTPEEALRSGQPQIALRLLRKAHGGPGVDLSDAALLRKMTERDRVVVAAASLDTGHWEDASVAIRAMQEPRHVALMDCYLAGRRGDVDAARRCEAAIAAPAEGVEALARASGRFGLAAAREHDRRVEEAAAALKAAVAEVSDPRNQRMQLDFLERQGWIKEAIEVLEAWRAASPEDKTIVDRLTAALERKVRGDLLEKRGAEAEVAARRLIEVAPARAGTWRYHLAEALTLLGKAEDAVRELAAAKASGAPAPKRPDAVREMDPSTWPAEVRGPPPGASGAVSPQPPGQPSGASGAAAPQTPGQPAVP